MTTLSIIAAVGNNLELGKDNKLLWHLSSDLKRFKELTTGHTVIMGRKTFESILGYLGKPLPNRQNIVISTSKKYDIKGVITVTTIEEAIIQARQLEKNGEIFIIGGAQIYKQTIDLVDKLYLTVVDGDFEADVFFPNYDKFHNIDFEMSGEENGIKYRFLALTKKEKD